MCVCMYVCLYVCMYVCMYVRMYVYMYAYFGGPWSSGKHLVHMRSHWRTDFEPRKRRKIGIPVRLTSPSFARRQ